MTKPRNKKHGARVAPYTRILRRVLNLMNNNSFVVSDTHTLLQAYQHVYYCQGVYKASCNKKHQIKYFNQIKAAFERVLDKIAKSCPIDEYGKPNASADMAINFHKVTRGKIAYFCTGYQAVHKKIDDQWHKAAIVYAREMLNYYILIKQPPFSALVEFC